MFQIQYVSETIIYGLLWMIMTVINKKQEKLFSQFNVKV